jgi:hypothetical protein
MNGRHPNHYLLLSTTLLGVELEEIENNKCNEREWQPPSSGLKGT